MSATGTGMGVPLIPTELLLSIIELSLPPFHPTLGRLPQLDRLRVFALVSPTFRDIAQTFMWKVAEYDPRGDRVFKAVKLAVENERCKKLAAQARTVRVRGAAVQGDREIWRKLEWLHPRTGSLWLSQTQSPRDIFDRSYRSGLYSLHLDYHKSGSRIIFNEGTVFPVLRRLAVWTCHWDDLTTILDAAPTFPNLQKLFLLLSFSGRRPSPTTFPGSPTSLTRSITSLSLLAEVNFGDIELPWRLLSLFPALTHLRIGVRGRKSPNHDFSRLARHLPLQLETLALLEGIPLTSSVVAKALKREGPRSLRRLSLHELKDFDGDIEIQEACQDLGIELVDEGQVPADKEFWLSY
ncbi:hypothetical protein P7C70_g2285, partial [Phenoliferia sp. Uapishka_3]